MPGSEKTMPKGGRQIQRNCLRFAEPPDAQPPSRSGSADYRTAVIEQRARSGTAATGGTVVELRARAQAIETKWKVRVHWGIIFAVIASLALWLSIRALIGFLF